MEKGKVLYTGKEYAKAVEAFSEELSKCPTSTRHLVLSNRSAAFLQINEVHAAWKDAKECVELQPKWCKGYSRLGAALFRMKKYDECVGVYKKGLELEPENINLQEALSQARLAVLDNLDEDDSDENDENKCTELTQQKQVNFTTEKGVDAANSNAVLMKKTSGEKIIQREPGSVFEKHFSNVVERITEILTIQILSRKIIMELLRELNKHDALQPGIFALVIGIMCMLIVHRTKLMLLSILIICFMSSGKVYIVKQAFTRWIENSVDKLNSIAALPCMLYCIPMVLRIYGQTKLFWFVHNDYVMSMILFAFTTFLYLYAFLLPVDERKDWWGIGKRLKFVAHIIIFIYWVVLRRNFGDFFRLFAPAAVECAGILLSSMKSADIQSASKIAVQNTIKEITNDVTKEVGNDVWFMMGLVQWTVDYWQQPTTFTLDDLVKGLQFGISTLHNQAVESFRPEIENLRRQFDHMKNDGDYEVLVKYVQETVRDIPPSKFVTYCG